MYVYVHLLDFVAHTHTLSQAAADFSEIYKLSIIYSPAKLYGKSPVNWQ